MLLYMPYRSCFDSIFTCKFEIFIALSHGELIEYLCTNWKLHPIQLSTNTWLFPVGIIRWPPNAIRQPHLVFVDVHLQVNEWSQRQIKKKKICKTLFQVLTHIAPSTHKNCGYRFFLQFFRRSKKLVILHTYFAKLLVFLFQINNERIVL